MNLPGNREVLFLEHFRFSITSRTFTSTQSNITMRTIMWITFCLLAVSSPATAQSTSQTEDYWELQEDSMRIVWDLQKETRLPHAENIEMSGQKVSAILYYTLDENRMLTLERDVIFPQLRTYNKAYEPDWKKYRAYFRRKTGNEVLPNIRLDDKIIQPAQVDSIAFNGMLTFFHAPQQGVQISRTFYPAMTQRLLVEHWGLQNTTTDTLRLSITNASMTQTEQGYKGLYRFEAFSKAPDEIVLLPGKGENFSMYFGATLNQETKDQFQIKQAESDRLAFLNTMMDNLVLETPDPVINRLFAYSKIRASESIFESSKMGLVHSPGGGNYYLGIWANDQVEYSGPFFPYLGYDIGNTAALNTYKWFQKNIPDDGSHIPYAFEMDGNFHMDHLDRGDAAMIAYGTTHYALATGDKGIAQQLWPLIEWSLDYCHSHRNQAGAVLSESDEMEGRIPTGDANLSTSSLYYGGLKLAQSLAKVLDYSELAQTYRKRQAEMKQVINTYFAGTIEGLDTYRYYDGNENLRHWICLPLCMDIQDKKEATLNALFDKLWTEDGILVELNQDSQLPPTFWDRATLYAFRGAFKVGAANRGYEKLQAFSRKRLLGDHVPYVIEAYPENNKKHLSAESALYCRIFTEGMLGLEPTGLDSIKLKPSLPDAWDFMRLRNIRLFGQSLDVEIQRDGAELELHLSNAGKTLLKKKIKNQEEIIVRIPH